MGKILFYAILRHGVTLFIAFIAAKGVISSGVAERLNAGDTVELWKGGYSVSVTDVVNYLAAALPVAVLPVVAAWWGKIRDRYKLIIAARTPARVSPSEVKAAVRDTRVSEIIATVARNS